MGENDTGRGYTEGQKMAMIQHSKAHKENKMKALFLFTNIHKISWWILIIIISVYTALPVLAEQASAESADFTVNTIPEPSALVLLLVAGLIFWRSRRAKTLCIALLAFWITIPGLDTYAAAPIVTNVTAQQQALPSTDVDISYDLYDDDSDSQYVMINVSTNSGKTYDVVATHFTGEIGFGIITGEYKNIIWDAAEDLPFFSSSTVRVKITVHTEMSLIPAGSFDMGNTFGKGYSNELPVHSVYVSEFYIDKYEVSNDKVRQVMQWAYDNGKITANESTVQNNEGNQKQLLDLDTKYCQISHTNDTFSVDSGKENYPCVEISWYGAMAYCKYRNEMERKEQTINLADWSIDWSKKGYRLPTEAEWEKAARGGVAGYRFPWSDTNIITHSRANYYSGGFYYYDRSPTHGYHPDYNTGTKPYTSPVGSFAPNGYGLYDMAGNVIEWCWDRWDESYYKSQTNWSNPLGPDTGTDRVIRGGSWDVTAGYVRCASRYERTPGLDYRDCGFRCVRKAE
jgi:formylglycine-generating enzyme required for sulfatase activity